MFGKHKYYPTRGSLEPVRQALSDAAALSDETFRKRWQLNVPPSAAGIAGGVVGAGLGKGALIAGAAAGTKGAAALTSGLAFAGAAIGGGMAAGIAMVAVPVAVVGAGAFAFAKHKQQLKLTAEKEELLREAISRHEIITKMKNDWAGGNEGLLDHIRRIDVRLEDAISHLKHDLDDEPPSGKGARARNFPFLRPRKG